MSDTSIIDYYHEIGLGPTMQRCELHTQINIFHTLYGGGWTEKTARASRSLYRRMKRSGILEVNVWKRKDGITT